MLVGTSKTVFLKSSHVGAIDKLVQSEIKKVRKKYAKRIQQEWYDFSDNQVDEKIRSIDHYFNSLHEINIAIHSS
jgi:hypothetical protein